MAYIMIIDDDEDFAVAAAELLRVEGHEVRIELKTDTAEQHMRERRPDLAVLDVMFPGDSCGGFQFARALHHGGESLKDIPILMLTAVNQRFPFGFGSSDIDEETLPVAGFLEKPADLDVLRSKVAELLARTAASEAEGS